MVVQQPESYSFYEMFMCSEWFQEPEPWRTPEKVTTGNDTPSISPKRLIAYFSQYAWPPDDFTSFLAPLLPWHLAISPNGKLVAVLQELLLEIRASKDEYTSIIGRATVYKDCCPQLRKLLWSPDSQRIAVGSSDGLVNIYDIYGVLVYSIPVPQNLIDSPSSIFVAGLEFLKVSSQNKRQNDVLVVYSTGHLCAYDFTFDKKCEEVYRIQLERLKPGISCSAFLEKYNLLILASRPQATTKTFKNSSLTAGISAWRLLNEYPYFQMIFPIEDEFSLISSNIKVWKLFSSSRLGVAVKLRISHSQQYLASLHTCGTIMTLLLPSLKFHGKWSHECPELKPAEKIKTSSDILPVDIEWRPDDSLIVTRKDGSICIHDISTFDIDRGFGCEYLNGYPRLSSSSQVLGFLSLECELSMLHSSRNNDTTALVSDEKSFLNSSFDMIQSTLYVITDLENFKPKKKTPKLMQRVFRLYAFKSVTPEGLFHRMLDNDEYEGALELADKFNIDSDLVYKKQWQKSSVTSESIVNCLSKVRNIEWVLGECVSRFPETVNGALSLIEFGFHITSFDKVFTGKSRDFLEEIRDVNKLTEFQKQMIKTRLVLIDYSDKLQIFKKIFNPDGLDDLRGYSSLRSCHVVVNAIELAKNGNWVGVEIAFNHFSKEISQYWLTVLNHIPETISPSAYCSLLPKCDSNGRLLRWCSSPCREKDWVERNVFTTLKPQFEVEEMIKYKPIDEYTMDVLTEWYMNRSLEVARRGQVVSNAVELIEIGKENNIKGLDKLYFELLTLECFVYEIDHEMDYDSLSKMTESEKGLKMLKNSDEYSFNYDVETLFLPFVERSSNAGYSNKSDLIISTFKIISTQHLDWLINLLHSSLDGLLDIGELPFIAQLTVECIYAYNDLNLLEESLQLVVRAYIRVRTDLANEPHGKELMSSLATLRNEIVISKLLVEHNLNYSVKYIHSVKNSTEDALKIMKEFAKTIEGSSDFNDDACKDYVDHLLKLEKLFKECVPPNCTYEIFSWAVLNSGDLKLFDSLNWVLCHKKELERKCKLTYDKSLELVLDAARNYFNISRDYKDNSLKLANACLYLIENDSEDVQEEIDLIQGIQILHEIGVNQIPLQVREMEDRMKLVNHSFKKSKTLFKKPELVYRLAACLRVYGSDSNMRHRILSIRLAEEAFHHKEFNLCASFCEEIIRLNCQEGWEICRAVAQSDEYSNLEKKCELVNFALTCAPDNELPCLLKIRRSLIEQASQESQEEYHSDISSSIQKACFGCPAFYESLHKKPYITDLFPTYDTIGSAKASISHQSTSDTLECCLKYVCEDTFLGLNYMLCYENPEACEDVFKALPQNLFTFELAILYYSFMSLTKDQMTFYLTRPTTELLKKIETFPGDVKYRGKIDSYKKKCSDYHIVQRLSHMEHTGIDYERYISDSDYKRDTILGLSLFPEHADEALLLAAENEISLAEVTITSIKSSLLNNDTGSLKETLENENVIKGLQSNPKLVFDTLLSVFEHLDGRNHSLMINFFTVLKVTDDETHVFDLPPSQHIKVLKRLKSVDQDIRYQDLISSKGNLYTVFKDCITPHSLNSIVKFIKTLPNGIKRDFEMGSLFLEFMVDQYKFKCLNAAVSAKKCVNNFQSCLSYLDKLSEKNTVEFLSRTILSLETLHTLEASRRKLLLASFSDYYRKQIKGSDDADDVETLIEDNLEKLNLIYNDEDDDVIFNCPEIESYLLKIELSNGKTETLRGLIEDGLLDATLSTNVVRLIHKASRLELTIEEIIKSITATPENKLIIDKRKIELSNGTSVSSRGSRSNDGEDEMTTEKSPQIFNSDLESGDVLSAFKSAGSLGGFRIAVELVERLSDTERKSVCGEVLKMYVKSNCKYNKFEAAECVIKYVDFSNQELAQGLLQDFDLPTSDKKYIIWLLLKSGIPAFVNEAMSRFNNLELSIIKEYFKPDNSVPSSTIAQALINSFKYCDFIRYLKEEEDSSTLESVVNALAAAGASSESGTLKMTCNDVPISLRSFYQSLR